MKIKLTDKNDNIKIVDYEEFKESQQLFYNYVVELAISSVRLQDVDVDVDFDFEFESYSEEIMSAYDYDDEDFEVEEYVSSIYENYIEDIQRLINKYSDIEII